MQSDSVGTPSTATTLSARAGIAALTLQLRTAIQEAAAWEAEEAAVDYTVAREQLRARLEPLVRDRRAALDSELCEVREQAAATLQAARREAAEILSRRAERVVPAQVNVVDESPELPTVDDLAWAEELVSSADVEITPEPVIEVTAVEAPVVEAPVVEPVVEAMPPAAPPTEPEPRVRPADLATQQPTPVTVVLDAEAFARAFATVFASVLDSRYAALTAGQLSLPPAPGLATQGAQAHVPVVVHQKQSFWAHARHVDVLLMGAAAAIVLIVLAAWMV